MWMLTSANVYVNVDMKTDMHPAPLLHTHTMYSCVQVPVCAFMHLEHFLWMRKIYKFTVIIIIFALYTCFYNTNIYTLHCTTSISHMPGSYYHTHCPNMCVCVCVWHCTLTQCAQNQVQSYAKQYLSVHFNQCVFQLSNLHAVLHHILVPSLGTIPDTSSLFSSADVVPSSLTVMRVPWLVGGTCWISRWITLWKSLICKKDNRVQYEGLGTSAG